MDTNYVGADFVATRERRAFPERYIVVAVTRQHAADALDGVEVLLDPACDGEHDVLLVDVADTDRPRVFATVSRIDGNNRVPRRLRISLAGRCRCHGSIDGIQVDDHPVAVGRHGLQRELFESHLCLEVENHPVVRPVAVRGPDAPDHAAVRNRGPETLGHPGVPQVDHDTIRTL